MDHFTPLGDLGIPNGQEIAACVFFPLAGIFGIGIVPLFIFKTSLILHCNYSGIPGNIRTPENSSLEMEDVEDEIEEVDSP